MHIGIDARMYGPITRGIGRYIQETITELEKIDTKNQYTIFLYSENFNDYIPQNPNFKKVLAPWRWYTLAEQFHFPHLIKKHNPDIMHFPHFNVPYFYNGPFITTIHDLILLRDTQKRATTLGPLIYLIKKIFYKKIIKHAVTKAQHIIAVTNYGKQDILHYFNSNEKKISTIYEGVSLKNIHQDYIDTTAHLRYTITKPFLIYVGSAYPHKNLENLILSLDEITTQYDIELFLVGRKDFFYQRLEQEMPRPYIKYLEYVPDKDLAYLFQQATAYVFPSRYEGFGLPPLEAMAHGCPVISSDASCLPEVLGNAAYYFNPNSTQDITSAITKVLTDKKLRTTYIERGFQQVHNYNWHTSAEQTLSIYKRFAP